MNNTFQETESGKAPQEDYDSTLKHSHVNWVRQGSGAPVILIHGLAASLHDWDALLPALASGGYSGYALDLLGHGESAKPDSRSYHVDWLADHLSAWVEALALDQPPVLVGHSLGGYLALDYAHRFPKSCRALVLVDPFYQLAQLPALLRFSYRSPALNTALIQRIPRFAFRLIIDLTSVSLGHTGGALYSLPEHVRAQTALDYKRTNPGVYNIPHTLRDLTSNLPALDFPSLVVWGQRDQTLSPASFKHLVELLPVARGVCLSSGHVPHQSNAQEFNQLVLEYLFKLENRSRLG